MKNVPMIIAFEGVDKSGKTTLMRKFNEATNYRYVCVDRFVISSMVYDEVFGRNRKKYLKKLLKSMKDSNVVIVRCMCEEHIARIRLEASNERLPEELRDIAKIEIMFDKAIEKNSKYFAASICVNTNMGLDLCVKELAVEIEEIERELSED